MFRIESYIASHISGYIERYVKNFRKQDAQVSLWEGDGSLHNLDLDLEVLEQELNLPFSFVSGHVHDLLIHVPWTRIASEPVRITINTIECVMKLKTSGGSTAPQSSDRKKRSQGTSGEETMTPPSYMSSLLHKVICNLSITCNNLILKYVEEDIVLSMNIKTLSLGSVNSKWASEFSELTPAQLIMRKLINLTDVTICLDKRNASGRIESYLEPLLYKCSLTVRLSRSYQSVNSSGACSTRVAVRCQNVALSISEPQVSMLMRLALLARMTMNQPKTPSSYSISSSELPLCDIESDADVLGQTWTSWIWGWVPTLMPAGGVPVPDSPTTHALHVGCYIDNFTVDFKLVKMDEGKSWESLLQVILGGCFAEMTSNNIDWTNHQIGICSATIIPVPRSSDETYLLCGEVPHTFYSESLFENPDSDIPQRGWDYHIAAVTESIMLERAPTFAVDYLSHSEMPPGYDDEFNIPSDPREKVLVRYVFGPLEVSICSGLIQRLNSISRSISNYDYLPYSMSSTVLGDALDDLQLLYKDDSLPVDHYVSQHVSQFTAFGPKFKIYHADILPSEVHQKISSHGSPSTSFFPYVLIETRCLDAKLIRPLDPEKLVTLVTKLTPDDEIISAAQSSVSVMLVGVKMSVAVKESSYTEIMNVPNLSLELALNNVLKTPPDSMSRLFSMHIEKIALKTTKAMLHLVIDIIVSIIYMMEKKSTILKTTLLHDCINTVDPALVELILNEIRLKYIETDQSEGFAFSMNNANAFTNNNKSEVRTKILTSEVPHGPVLEVTAQRPLGENSNHPPLLIFSLKHLNITLGPALYAWISYVPLPLSSGSSFRWDSSGSGLYRKISSSSFASGGQKPRDSLDESVSEVDSKWTLDCADSLSLESGSLKWFSLVLNGEILNVCVTFYNCISFSHPSYIVTQLPSVYVRSAQGKVPLNCDKLPVLLPESTWTRNKMNFPWSVGLTDFQCYTKHGSCKLSLIKPLSVTCTVAVTTKLNLEFKRLAVISLCLHLDTTPISIGVSRQQVALVAEVSSSLLDVYSILYPPAVVKHNREESAVIMTDTMASSDDSNSLSQSQAPDTKSGETPGVKLTCWLQWTLAKCTISLFNQPSKSAPESLKLVLDIDDIFITLDVEKVYQKLKLKVATASIQHYTRESSSWPWRLGAYRGVVMREHGPEIDRKNSTTEFMSITLTRASAINLHEKLNSTSHAFKKVCGQHIADGRYIVEIVVALEPLDFVLSPVTLGKFLGVIEPLLVGRRCSVQQQSRQQGWSGFNQPHQKAPQRPLSGQPSLGFTTASLPLLYLNLQYIRILLPATLLPREKNNHDVIVVNSVGVSLRTNFHTILPQSLHDLIMRIYPEDAPNMGSEMWEPLSFMMQFTPIEGVSLKSEAVNPVTRKILRSDLYASAQRARVTTLPGSNLEDRQYQLDFSLSLSTGDWSEIVPQLDSDETCGQNPAVYWNSGVPPGPAHLRSLLSSLNVCLIVAPPIMTKGFVVSGLNVEFNIVSEVDISMSLDQMSLVCHLLDEVLPIFPTKNVQESKRMVEDSKDVTDSGVESFDGSLQRPLFKKEQADNTTLQSTLKSCSVSQLSVSTPTSINAKRSRHRSQTVPIDILLTGKGICFKLFSSGGNGKLYPLVYISITQPYISLEKQGDTSIHKASIFDLVVKVGSKDDVDSKIDINSYNNYLISTEKGDPDPYKGIPPALINFKSTTQGNKSPVVDVELGRPVQISCSVPMTNFLTSALREIKEVLNSVDSNLWVLTDGSNQSKEDSTIKEEVTSCKQENSIDKLKQCMQYLSVLNFSTKQIAVYLLTADHFEGNGLFSIGSSNGTIQFGGSLSQQKTFTIQTTLRNTTVSTVKGLKTRLVLNPWSLGLTISVSWESWLPSGHPPLITTYLDSDILSIDFSRTQMEILTYVLNEFSQFAGTSSEGNSTDIGSEKDNQWDDEQHYKDDLQAGAFQFVNVHAELPLAYQVAFPTPYHMAWTYPAPRAITRLKVLPIPFREANPDGIKCTMQYHTGSGWKDWVTFSVSESAVTEVELPQQREEVASTWRVVVVGGGSSSGMPVQALAAALRIDSAFSPRLLPRFRFSAAIDSFHFNLWMNTARFVGRLSPPLGRFFPDDTLPPEYCYTTVIVEQLKFSSFYRHKGYIFGDVNCRLRMDVLNCRTLQQQCCIQPFPFACSLILKDVQSINLNEPDSIKCHVSLIAGPILVCIAPAVTHTVFAALTDSVPFPYVVCNDSCIPIRFGQVGTDEEIFIESLQCHFYAWRTTKQKMHLRFSINITENKNWSNGIALDLNKDNVVELLDDLERNITVIVTVKHLTATFTQVVISGQLTVYNLLDCGVDIRIVANTITERQRCLLVKPRGKSSSVILSREAKYSVRISIEGQWSGLVPLHGASNAWLVKVPLKDKQDYVSIWCQVFWDKDVDFSKMLVTLCPIYLLRSMLPCDANVLVFTDELHTERMQRVRGQGTLTNLNTPGTTVHHHSLTFHIDGNLPASSPHVPLSYSMLDGKSPPPPPPPNVETLLEWSETKEELCWPLLGPLWESVRWFPSVQPDTVTHVKVRFGGDSLRVTNSLLVELQPWALLINTLGLSISLQTPDRILCSLPNFSILAPPSLEETFYLVVELSDGFHRSSSLQLSKGQAFYMPQISGLVPSTGSIQTNIHTRQSVVSATIHSKIASGIRVLHVTSSYAVANLSSYDLAVSAVVVRREERKFRIPDVRELHSIQLPKQTGNNVRGQPIPEWYAIGSGCEHIPYLIFRHMGQHSNPIFIPTDIERDIRTLLLPCPGKSSESINTTLVAVIQKKDNITYITIDDQLCPQIVIHNHTAYSLCLAKYSMELGGSLIDDYVDWEWRLIVPSGKSAHYFLNDYQIKIPQIPLVVSRPEFNRAWSTPISVEPSSSSRLVNVPHCHDLSVTVSCKAYTTHVTLTAANQCVISASDIRSRLSLHSAGINMTPEELNTEEPSELKDEVEKMLDQPVPAPSSFELVLPKVTDEDSFGITCFLRGLTVILCKETTETYQWTEVAALTLDNIGVTVNPFKNTESNLNELLTRITIWDIQLDNQEYQCRNYDFSVVLLRTEKGDRGKFVGDNAELLVATSRNSNPALDINLVLSSISRPLLQDIQISLCPLQVYVEDVYLTGLKEHMMNILPSVLVTGLSGYCDSASQLSTGHCSPTSEVLQDVKSSGHCESVNPEMDDTDDLFNVSEVNESPPIAFPTPAKSEVIGTGEEEGCDEERVYILTRSGSNGEVAPLTPEIGSQGIPFPQDVVSGTFELSRPLRFRHLSISEFHLLFSLHTSTRLYIAVDNSPLSFTTFKRNDVVTTPYRLGHALTVHYVMGALYGTGWAIGSLQMLGAPAGLARSVGCGLKSFVTMPYKGITEGPAGFLLGVLHGSASLMKHITAGTLMSVTKFASSWSRTLDRLTLDEEDLRYAEEMRRIKPQGLGQALRQGLTEFGVSILGGLGGLAQQPLQYALHGQHNNSLVGSVSRGLVGVMARPLSGAAELVALTGHGILSGAGWADNHLPKHQPIVHHSHCDRDSQLKYVWKVLPKMENVLLVTEATSGDYEPVALVLTNRSLHIVNRDDVLLRSIKLAELTGSRDKCDPTLVRLHIQSPDTVAEKISEKRIAEFVRESQRALKNSGADSSLASTPASFENDPLLFYISPLLREHFLNVLDLATRHATTRGFIVSF